MIKKLYPLMLIFIASHLFGQVSALPDQTVLLQTDRFCYVSGDLILLKVVHLQSDVTNALKESVIYVDIIDRDSQFVAGEIFKLDRGIASGFLRLPDATKTGYFKIRVYTYKSRNCVGQKILSSKQIFVTNRFNGMFEKYEGDDRSSMFNSDSVFQKEPNTIHALKPVNTASKHQLIIPDTIQSDPYSALNDSVIYVDIIDKDSQLVASEIYNFDQGIASGFIRIPDSVKNGFFFIRAYNAKFKNSAQKKVASKQLLATKQYDQTKENSNDDSSPPELNNTSKYLHQEPNNILKLADTIFNKRSRVTGSIQFDRENLNDTAWLALSVKPVSACESQLAFMNKKFVQNKNVQDKSCKQDITDVENKGIIVSGHVTDSITGNPLSNLLILMAIEDSTTRIQYSITNEKGDFKFLLSDIYKNQVAYLSAYNYPKLLIYPQAKITIDSKFFDNAKTIAKAKSKVGNEYSTDSLNVLKSIVSIAYDINLVDEQAYTDEESMPFHHQTLAGKNMHTVLLENYIDLPDFNQISKEILSFVQLEQKDDKYVLSVIGENYVIRKNPAVFVDGVPLSDIAAIMNMGTDEIRKIQVQCEPRYFGDVPFDNGIILIWTRKMDFWSTKAVKYAHAFTLPCFQKPCKFNFPDYSKEKIKTRPDFRKILFWEPSITIEKNEPFNFSFYTSDEVGVFEVLLQGINKSKQPVIIRKYIRVK